MTSKVVNQERTPSDSQFQCRLCFLIQVPRRRRRLCHRSSHLRSWTELVDASAIIWSEWNILKFLVSSSSCAKLVEAHITGNGSHLASNRAPLKNLRAIKKRVFQMSNTNLFVLKSFSFRQFLTFAFWVSCLLQDLALAQHRGFSRSCPPPIFVENNINQFVKCKTQNVCFTDQSQFWQNKKENTWKSSRASDINSSIM